MSQTFSFPKYALGEGKTDHVRAFTKIAFWLKNRAERLGLYFLRPSSLGYPGASAWDDELASTLVVDCSRYVLVNCTNEFALAPAIGGDGQAEEILERCIARFLMERAEQNTSDLRAIRSTLGDLIAEMEFDGSLVLGALSQDTWSLSHYCWTNRDPKKRILTSSVFELVEALEDDNRFSSKLADHTPTTRWETAIRDALATLESSVEDGFFIADLLAAITAVGLPEATIVAGSKTASELLEEESLAQRNEDAMRIQFKEHRDRFEGSISSPLISIGMVTPGDVFRLPTRRDIPFAGNWVALVPHPESEELIFCVPIDWHASMGPADVAARLQGRAEAAVARCSLGHWFLAKGLQAKRRVGKLEPRDCYSCQETLSSIVRSTLSPTDSQASTANDPSYWDFQRSLEDVGTFVRKWSTNLAETGVALRFIGFSISPDKDWGPTHRLPKIQMWHGYRLKAGFHQRQDHFASFDESDDTGVADPVIHVKVINDGDRAMQLHSIGINVIDQWTDMKGLPQPVSNVMGPDTIELALEPFETGVQQMAQLTQPVVLHPDVPTVIDLRLVGVHEALRGNECVVNLVVQSDNTMEWVSEPLSLGIY